MAAEKTIPERLSELYKLQQIDSQLDEIQVLKGELPMEVRDLEDEIEGLQIRISKLEDSKKDLEEGISQHQGKIKESEKTVKEESGIGLLNVKRRLDLSYENNYKLEVQETKDSYSVELKLNLT